MSRRVPELHVEKLHLGELSEAEAARVRAQLEADGELHRLRALEASDRELAARLRPLPRPASARPPRRWLAPTLAIASVGLVLALAWPLMGSGPSPMETLRSKGGPVLNIHRLGANGPELLSHGQSARDGDRLQLSARLPTPAHLAILSVDGLGVVTVHQPPTDAPVRELALDRSFVLDAAPHHERFFLFASTAPMAADRLVTAVRLTATPSRPGAHMPPEGLPENIVVIETRLEKPDTK